MNFGTVALGSDFSSNVQNGNSVTYICNGNYNQQVKVISPWTGSGYSVSLNTIGTPDAGEFSMKANATATLGTAVIVTTGYITIATGTRTGEGGNTSSANTLWLKLGEIGMPSVLYSGTIYYGITP